MTSELCNAVRQLSTTSGRNHCLVVFLCICLLVYLGAFWSGKFHSSAHTEAGRLQVLLGVRAGRRPRRPQPLGRVRGRSSAPSGTETVGNASMAKHPHLFLAMLCKTAPANFERRAVLRPLLETQIDTLTRKGVLRRSGGSKSSASNCRQPMDLPTRTVNPSAPRSSSRCGEHPLVTFYFVLGQGSLDTDVLSRLRRESTLYSDLLMADFVDSYHRLTAKLLWILHWASEILTYTYLLVMDDDSFIDLQSVLASLGTSPRLGLYGGGSSPNLRTPVVRQPKHRWFVPRSIYGPDTYPPYHVGVGVVLSADVVQKCLPLERNVTQFGVDDAYLGVMMERCGMKATRIQGILKMAGRCQQGMQPLMIGNMPFSSLEKIGAAYGVESAYHYVC